MEARKRFMSIDPTKIPDPPMPSYTFALYNRGLFEKSKFKDYDSLLENRLARSQARAKNLAMILENSNMIGENGTRTRPQGAHKSKRDNGNVPKTTSLQFADGEYVASFILGTDQQTTRHLLIDTGSDLVWWQCGPCAENKCYEQKTEPLYDLFKSKTYRKLDCVAESRNCVFKSKVIDCIPQGNTCIYDYKYGDGSRTRGWIAKDVITFVLDQNQVSILFGCGRDQTSGSAFSREFSGIAGLGRREVPWFPSLSRNFGNDMTGSCFVDTGVTVTSFPQDFYTVFRDTFRKEVNIPVYDAPLGNFDTCYMVDPGVVPTFPVVKMYFGQQNPENLLLLEQKRVVVHERGLFCMAFTKWDQPLAIIGSYQLQGIGLTFDTATETLSFELDACS
ncbi:aspartyl protease family protein 2-like [Solanum verrucosum]|uniref:aspartyl protease family protein 2-like n=1 Tax=Solanum verrucosum TaxID=315347 RepID=UPI0020CFF0AB|nr:aspartyl protease family protein 2-like [Solanum verrucosum]